MSKYAVIEVDGPHDQFAERLLEGELIAYHDAQYEVTSGKHEILMKLLRDNDRFVIFYLQVPYAYPIPDGIKTTVKKALEVILKQSITELEFINAGTEAQKRNLHFRVQLAGERGGTQ